MNLKTKTISYESRVKTFWLLVSIFVLCLVVYVSCVRSTISNTITRVSLESATADLSASVGEMEFSFIGLENKISLNTAYERGFQNVSAPIYVSRSSGRSLSMNVVGKSDTLSR